jgi:osmoprotectant transport system substrate-binding protein
MTAAPMRSRRASPTLISLCAVILAAAGLTACGGAKHQTTAAGTAPGTTTTSQLPGTGRPPVTVGDKNTFPEQFILGALYEQALAAQGYSVSLNRNIGPTDVTIRALQSGSVSFYPESIGTWLTDVAGYKHTFPTADAAYQAGQHFALAHGFQLLNPTPFSDTSAIGVTLAYAVQHDLSTIGDLRKLAPGLTIGGPPQFENSPTGLAGVEQAYGFAPAGFKPLPFGEQYTALDKGTVQAADVNTTDGQLAGYSYAVLRDPAHVFGWGNIVPVVTEKVLDEEGPAFQTTIDKVSSLLTTAVIRQLNAAVAVDHQDPAKVAKQFLEAHHMVEPSQST